MPHLLLKLRGHAVSYQVETASDTVAPNLLIRLIVELTPSASTPCSDGGMCTAIELHSLAQLAVCGAYPGMFWEPKLPQWSQIDHLRTICHVFKMAS